MNGHVCRICGRVAVHAETGRVSNGYPLMSCSHCGTILVDVKPTPGNLGSLYDDLFAGTEYEHQRQQFERITSGKRPRHAYRMMLLRRAEKMVEGRRLVEIGGGTGAFGHSASCRGWSYVDYDLSDIAISAVRRIGLKAFKIEDDSRLNLAEECADAVAMWEVIEHIWDVHQYLGALTKGLSPGGVLLLSTPNYLRRAYRDNLERKPSPAMSPPVHLNFFTAESLVKTLIECSFEVTAVIKRRLYAPLPLTSGNTMRSIKLAAGVEEAPTLYAIARKPLS